VDVIEAGFPIASDGDFEAVKAISASGAAAYHCSIGARVRATSTEAGRQYKVQRVRGST